MPRDLTRDRHADLAISNVEPPPAAALEPSRLPRRRSWWARMRLRLAALILRPRYGRRRRP